MKKYLHEIIKKIGINKVVVYIISLNLFYIFYCLQPYFLSNIINNNYKLSICFLILTIISFLSIAFIRFPNNYMLQTIRKYSKEVLWEENEKKNYNYFINQDVGEVQNLVNEISYATRSMQYESLQILIRSTIMIITYGIILVRYGIAISLLYVILYIFYFLISYYLSKGNSKGIDKVLNSSGKINSFIIDYYRNIESILTNHSIEYENRNFKILLDDERKAYYKLQRNIDVYFLIQQIILVSITVIIFGTSIVFKKENYVFIEILLVLIYSAFNLSSTGKDFLALLETKDRLITALYKLEYGNNYNKPNINFLKNENKKQEIISIDNIPEVYMQLQSVSTVTVKAMTKCEKR